MKKRAAHTDLAAGVRVRAQPSRRQSKPEDRRQGSRGGGRRATDPPVAKVETLWAFSANGQTYTCGLHVYESAWNVWILKQGELLACGDGFSDRAQAVDWAKRMRKQLRQHLE